MNARKTAAARKKAADIKRQYRADHPKVDAVTRCREREMIAIRAGRTRNRKRCALSILLPHEKCELQCLDPDVRRASRLYANPDKGARKWVRT
jgi:hypothetical protein